MMLNTRIKETTPDVKTLLYMGRQQAFAIILSYKVQWNL